jgi:hypothetical protein
MIKWRMIDTLVHQYAFLVHIAVVHVLVRRELKGHEPFEFGSQSCGLQIYQFVNEYNACMNM